MRAVALVGAQAGSEGKGAVAAALAPFFNVHVRTGGPNAGHTFYDQQGRKFVARGLPVGWLNREAKLVIGPGAVVDWKLLLEEIELAELAIAPGVRGTVSNRVYIDPMASVVTKEQHQAEGGTGGYAHQTIGSTGEGVGMCRIARISRRSLLRGPEFATCLASDVDSLDGMVRRYLWLSPDDKILLEGTQGSKLSLTHGPWPYVTSADTNAATLLADAGLSPGVFTKTILVARTFPIRVAGRSGPLPNETTWGEIGQPEERTTVTQKVRRVGGWDSGWVIDAIRLNHPAELVITFLDYLFPETKGMREWEMLPSKALDWLELVQQETQAPVVGVGTGPDSVVFRPGYLP